MADGRKFSGNAFRLDHGIGLHHGTLLVSSDLDRVGRYLTAAPAALKIRGIASVRSPVTNLQKYRPDIDVRTWQTELAAAFICEFAGSNHPPGSVLQAQDRAFAADPLFSDLAAQFASWEWRFGETLAFDAELSETFAWGSVELMFHVNRGRVQTARLAGDNLDNAWADRIERAMIGQPFCSADLAQSLRTAASQPGGAAERQVLMAEDLAALIVRQGW
jgi:lipoate-protein ligase A